MKTLREAKVGHAMLRIVSKGDRLIGATFVGNKATSQIDGRDIDEVWNRLLRDAGKSDPGFIGYDEARSRFLHWYPTGFALPEYVQRERAYKVSARERLLEAAPLEAAAEGEGYTNAIIKAIQRTNLIYPVEKTRASEMLRGVNGDRFVRAAARFTLEPSAGALAEMEAVLRLHDNARWTVATYLPFLWAPERHMFLKPQVTQDFARRVGHRFANDYQSGLNFETYESLLDLVTETEREIAVLAPRDRIDTQSFIWVIGEYKPGDEADPLETENAA
jgi:hypothetical protein